MGVNIPDGDDPYYIVSAAIGVGQNRSEAIDQAVSGWLGLTGKAVLEGVPRRASSTSAMNMGVFSVYPGAIAVRGPVELRWTAQREKQLLEALAPALGGLDPRVSHSAGISMVILGGGALDGQCLIDNRAAEKLCEAAKKFDWVGSPEGYMARQVYLIRPRLPAGR